MRYIGISNDSFNRHRSRRRVIQGHHLSYCPEEVAKVFRGEHLCITWMDRMRVVSSGFLKYLKRFVEFHDGRAVNLETGGEADVE